jgi:hypothetical protein
MLRPAAVTEVAGGIALVAPTCDDAVVGAIVDNDDDDDELVSATNVEES